VIFAPTTYSYIIETCYNENSDSTKGPKFGFSVAAECEGSTTIEYNWYRGESCTGKWLTGEYDPAPDPSDDPQNWRTISSGGIYPTDDKENTLCKKGGNILKIRVTNNLPPYNVEVYTVLINR